MIVPKMPPPHFHAANPAIPPRTSLFIACSLVGVLTMEPTAANDKYGLVDEGQVKRLPDRGSD